MRHVTWNCTSLISVAYIRPTLLNQVETERSLQIWIRPIFPQKNLRT